MRLKKNYFLGRVAFALLFISIFLPASHLVIFAATSPMNLNLEASIQIALESNIGYKIAESAVDVSQAQIEEVKGAKKINMKVQGGYLQMSETLDEEAIGAVSYTHLRAHETVLDLVCRLL